MVRNTYDTLRVKCERIKDTLIDCTIRRTFGIVGMLSRTIVNEKNTQLSLFKYPHTQKDTQLTIWLVYFLQVTMRWQKALQESPSTQRSLCGAANRVIWSVQTQTLLLNIWNSATHLRVVGCISLCGVTLTRCELTQEYLLMN